MEASTSPDPLPGTITTRVELIGHLQLQVLKTSLWIKFCFLNWTANFQDDNKLPLVLDFKYSDYRKLDFVFSKQYFHSAMSQYHWLKKQSSTFLVPLLVKVCFKGKALFDHAKNYFTWKLSTILKWKQESLPAWTPEAYLPPRSKCSLCWSVSWWQGGGTLSSLDGGGDTLGYPHPDLGWAYPLTAGWGVPPPSRPGMGYPISRVGYPPPSRPGMGYPLSGSGMGYPSPTQTWDGVVPPPPPQVWTDWKYYLPSSFRCGR